MKKSILVLVTSALFVTIFPGVAKATPSDTTIYPIVCASSGRVNVYLDYGINAITITNPNACHSTERLYISDGTGATWTYSQTIGGTTTSGSYDPAARPNFQTGAIGIADSFTLTLASTSDSSLTFSNGYRTIDVFFNNQINTLTPNPVAIGQQVTVTGSNLSGVSSLFLMGSSYFSVTTENRTATQLTFVVPSTVVNWFGATIPVTPGVYRLSSVLSKTLTITAAPIVVSVSAEELAAQRLSESMAAAAVREAEKMMARGEIEAKSKKSQNISIELFAQAEIAGITKENIKDVQAEIAALPEASREDLTQVLKIARKYEVLAIIASDRVKRIYSTSLIEAGLISADSKNKATLTTVVRRLPASERSSYVAIKKAIDAKMAEIQARKDRLTAILARIASRRAL